MNLAPVFRPGASLDVPVPASSGFAAPVPLDAPSGQYVVRLLATIDTYVSFGDPAMPGHSLLLAANYPEVFLMTGAKTISAISNSATTGTLNVTLMSR